MFSAHELASRTPSRGDWHSGNTKATSSLGKKGEALLKSLGYTITRCDNNTAFLLINQKTRPGSSA